MNFSIKYFTVFFLAMLFAVAEIAVSDESTDEVPVQHVDFEDKAVAFEKLEEDEREFINKFVEISNSGDIEQLKTIINKESLKCIDNDNQNFFEERFLKVVNYNIPDEYKILFLEGIRELPEGEKDEVAKFLYNPIEPTHALMFAYKKNATGKFVYRELIKDEDGFSLLYACPTDNGLARFNEVLEGRKKAFARADKLFTELKDPLRGELIALLKKGDKISAVKKYVLDAKENTAYAITVINLLEEEVNKK